jgi:DNA-binding NarL/FixJ family response regulator
MEVVGEAADGQEALDAIAALVAAGRPPDVALMDLVMPGMDGVTATAAITQRHPEMEVVAMTSFTQADMVHGALQAGAAGYLLKDAEADEVAAAIRAARRGEVHLDPAIAKQLTRSLMASKPQTVAALTDREREVLVLVAQGLSNQQIADSLVISERTARTHVSNILGKLGVASRTQAALLAIQEGIAPAPPGALATRRCAPDEDICAPEGGTSVRGSRKFIAVPSEALRPAGDEGTDVQAVPDDPRKARTLRVLIVDDDARVRRALRSLIECAPDLTVVGEAGSTPSATRLDLELLPDVVVLDLLLPQAPEGMEVLRELRGRDRPVVTISRMGKLRPRAMVAGAHAFLEQDGRDVDDLLDMIRAAYRHDPWPPGG